MQPQGVPSTTPVVTAGAPHLGARGDHAHSRGVVHIGVCLHHRALLRHPLSESATFNIVWSASLPRSVGSPTSWAEPGSPCFAQCHADELGSTLCSGVLLQVAFIRKGTLIWVKNVRSLISVSASASEECSEFAEQHTGLGTYLLPLRGHFRVVGKLWQCQNFLS